MPTPSSRAVTGARMTRRGALAAAAGLAASAVVGCTPQRQRRRGEEAPDPVEPEVDPDVLVAAEALANQEQILDLLGATGERHPRLAPRLAPLVAAHEAHAALLADAVPPDVAAGPTTSPTTSPSPTSDPDADPTRVPRNRARAIDRVVAAERELTTATKQHAFRARSGGFARLLGSMAAAAAQNEAVLASQIPAGGSR
ncbi:MAG TPA: hypothetical protein VK964_10040 [Nocardioidaceae bacterium]|nr:hypothetical protein [Nocardioidaceae bacterium]